MPDGPYAVKSIVTTELMSKICNDNNVTLYNVLTGFRYIGEVIKKKEQQGEGTFIFGAEESYGYLKGSYARDKDAVSTSMLICEMAAFYKKQGMTLIDALTALYEKYGYSFEKTEELYISGHDGSVKMAKLLDLLRADPPKDFAGSPVVSVGDYQKEIFTDMRTGETTPTGLPKSNVLYYKTADGDVIVVRPSGTEPKLKIYYSIKAMKKKKMELFKKNSSLRS